MSNEADTYAMIILAGGKSSRMKRDKATLLWKDKTFLDTLADKGRSLGFREILVSAGGQDRKGITQAEDIYRERGPLGGMHGAMSRAKASRCFVISVDIPQIEPSTIRAILEAHRQNGQKATLLSHGGRIEPLIGAYQTDVYRVIEEIIKPGPAPVRRLLDQIGYTGVELREREETVYNMNTPEDYQYVINALK